MKHAKIEITTEHIRQMFLLPDNITIDDVFITPFKRRLFVHIRGDSLPDPNPNSIEWCPAVRPIYEHSKYDTKILSWDVVD